MRVLCVACTVAVLRTAPALAFCTDPGWDASPTARAMYENCQAIEDQTEQMREQEQDRMVEKALREGDCQQKAMEDFASGKSDDPMAVYHCN